MLHLGVLIIFSLFAQSAESKANSATKTSDLIIVSGGQSEEHLKPEQLLSIDDQKRYVIRAFSLSARTKSNGPREVSIWSRGMGEIYFFELSLLGVFDNPRNPNEIRNALLINDSAKSQAGSPATDAQLLELLSNDANINETLRWQRRVALDYMRLFSISSFEHLFEHYQRQKEFAQTSSPTNNPEQLLSLLVPTNNVPVTNFGTPLSSQFIEALRSKGVLTKLLTIKVLSSDQPKLIGYLQKVDPIGDTKVTGEILFAVSGAEPQTLPVTLEFVQEETLLSKMLSAVPTTLVGLVGTLGGALIGYRFFLYQQARLRHLELEKKFADKKVEMSKAIRRFFKEDYDSLRNSQDEDIQKVKQIRDTLIETDIYAILLPEEVNKVNNLSDENHSVTGSRVEALHKILKENFAELMA